MIFDYLHDSMQEEEKKITNIYSITVIVYEVNQVNWDNLETRVCVQLGKIKKFTQVKQSSVRPYYNEFFTFDYEGPHDKMMDMILVIGVQNYRPGLRSHKLLGNARLDLGAIWSQPGHGISDKWILLTDPGDPSGHIRGYINCEIFILPAGESPPMRRFREPTEYFIPAAQGGGKLKARYIFRVHKGVNMYQSEKKEHKLYVRIFFAGLSKETTKIKLTKFPTWKEEIIFTELFPPMYNRVRIDVHFGKKKKITKFLNLSSMSDPGIKGYLPTYGPSFIYLYNPPYRYLGSLLVSLETLTVNAFSESEKLLGVRRQRTQDLVEKLFWNMEEFALFGIVYGLSMIPFNFIEKTALQIGISFSDSEERTYDFDNRYLTAERFVEPMPGSYWCWPINSELEALYIRDRLPDNRQRLFFSNSILHIAKDFAEDLSRIQFQIDIAPKEGKSRIEEASLKLQANCFNLKAAATQGVTRLDHERHKSIINKLNKVLKEIKKIKSISEVLSQFEKCVEIYKIITNLVLDPQESFPKIILTLRQEGKILAYGDIHARNILFAPRKFEMGVHCGKVQSVFLKGVSQKYEEFAGRVNILLWFGPYESVGYGLLSIPSGYEDISQLTKFPEKINYIESTVTVYYSTPLLDKLFWGSHSFKNIL